jgi:hypothetical protein
MMRGRCWAFGAVLAFLGNALACCELFAAEAPQVAVLRSAETEQARHFAFSAADKALLEQVERGCFNYLWKEAGARSGLVKDRRMREACSVGGVGFQLSALPIAVERGWITKAEGESRAVSILRTLAGRADNRKFGVLLHFVDLETAAPLPGRDSESHSTIDHALFLAGALAAGQYFGGEAKELASKFADETNWKAFTATPEGFLSMGWRPTGGGRRPAGFIEATWDVASDEERLLYFLAAGSPKEEFAVKPETYYRLKRELSNFPGAEPFVMSVNGSLFTYFFSHCWIDYGRFAADEPSQFGVSSAAVDWFENSRRAVLLHRRRCVEASGRFKTLAGDRWGFAPSTGFDAQGNSAYVIQNLRPNLMDRDDWEQATVAPYAAGSAIMFTPRESVAALRAYRELKGEDGKPLIWRDPATGGYAFADSFNLDQRKVSDDNIAIDVGPMLLAIENARSGLVWRLFMASPVATRAVERLKWQAYAHAGPP